MNKSLFLVPLLFLFACQSEQKKPKKELDPKLLISCEGIGEIKLSDTYESLEKRYGAKALTEHENTIAGKYTTIWEGTPKELNVYWIEREAPFTKVRMIETSNPSSEYMTRDSVQVGMGLRDLVKKNGSMPVTFRNFYALKDNGVIVSMNNGKVQENSPCFAGVLEWESQSNIYKDKLDEFKKQEVVESFDDVVQKMEVFLSAIRVEAKQ